MSGEMLSRDQIEAVMRRREAHRLSAASGQDDRYEMLRKADDVMFFILMGFSIGGGFALMAALIYVAAGGWR